MYKDNIVHTDNDQEDPLRMMLVKSEIDAGSWYPPPAENVDSSVFTEDDAYAALQLSGDGQVKNMLQV